MRGGCIDLLTANEVADSPCDELPRELLDGYSLGLASFRKVDAARLADR
jgi:hypothetical protein